MKIVGHRPQQGTAACTIAADAGSTQQQARLRRGFTEHLLPQRTGAATRMATPDALQLFLREKRQGQQRNKQEEL